MPRIMRCELQMEVDVGTDGEGLPFGHDPVGAVNVASEEVFEEVVAVEATAALSQLGDPRPDRVGVGVNRDRAGGGQVRSGDEFVAEERRLDLLVGGAPPQGPRSQ
jgi:hypothetical protein